MEYIVTIILQSLWFSVPMYLANMAPVLVKHVPFLNIPIDLGKTFRGKPIFGSHKTFRGFFFGILIAIVVVAVQTYLFGRGGFWEYVSIVPYEMSLVVLLGFLFGFGTLVGDAIESFFKRRVGIEPGGSWLFFDQVDYIVGALIFVAPIVVPSLAHIATMLVLGVLFSFASSYIGFHVGLKDSEV
jgi:CDP-2,3-bis-(O-geranylgeranyl)-sn-glycerol synthase